MSNHRTPFHLLAPRAGARRPMRLLVLLAAFLGFANAAFAQSFLHAAGPKILNASNQEVLLNGVNLGGWALQEGYIIKPGWQGINGRQTQGTVKKTLYNFGMSDAAVEAFYQSYRDNFITKADIDYLASKGFNCVRLPLHYDLFLTPAQRAVRNSVLRGTTTYDSYVGSLTSWYNGNQLFVDPANMEALRMIDNVLSWCAANKMYVVLDLHAAPGSQGTDVNIADAIQPLDLWNQAIYRDITTRLWSTISARYKNDARVAMYDLINEPNNVPSNLSIHDLLQRLINTVRAQGDNHLLLLEGNGFGNDFNYMEKRTFTNTANLVYNSHRYSGDGYLLDNNVNSTDPGNANSLRTIGNLTRFRTDNDVPIWVGETGENTASWMGEAARSLNSVGIGWCHWTYKRFEDGPNAALLHIPSPYIVDGVAGLPQVLINIQFSHCVPNPDVVNAVAPSANGVVNYPGGGNYDGTVSTAAPIGSTIWLKGSNDKYVSAENGTQAMTCNRTAVGTTEQFLIESAGGAKISLRSGGKYVSSENGTTPMTCNRTAVSAQEKFDWVVIGGGFIALRGSNDRYVSSEGGTLTCNHNQVGTTEVFRTAIISSSPLASRPNAKATPGFYPNPVAASFTYELPPGVTAHRLTVRDVAGRQVLAKTYGNTGQQNSLDVSPLKSGLYIVQISSPTFNTQFKISKQ